MNECNVFFIIIHSTTRVIGTSSKYIASLSVLLNQFSNSSAKVCDKTDQLDAILENANSDSHSGVKLDVQQIGLLYKAKQGKIIYFCVLRIVIFKVGSD